MITKPTVLILGAGASMPYGFPSGKKLIEIILDYLTRTGRNEYKQLLELGYNENELGKFKEALLLSQQVSIDSFLEHRPELIDLGKILIAQVILKYEQHDKLYDTQNQENWYQYLLNKMNAPFIEFGYNKVQILTFNYDRSLEYYLHNALKHTYNKPDKECAEKLNEIPIIHLHGKLGNLQWEDKENYIEYGDITSPEIIKKASESIKIIHEKDLKQSKEFQQAYKILFDENTFLPPNERIYFLGFGYHKTNLTRLLIHRWNCTNKIVKGSVYGLTALERGEINRHTANKFIEITNLSISSTLNNLEFIRNHVELN